jgi:hypothetical protein
LDRLASQDGMDSPLANYIAGGICRHIQGWHLHDRQFGFRYLRSGGDNSGGNHHRYCSHLGITDDDIYTDSHYDSQSTASGKDKTIPRH